MKVRMTTRLREGVARLTSLFTRHRLDRELKEDLATHFDLLVADYRRQGLDLEAARRAARLQFGTTEAALEAHHDARTFRWIEATAQDARYAVRTLRKQPVLALAVVLTLGLGIGIPTAVVSLLDGFAFRTPVSRDPAAYFRVALQDGGGRGVATLSLYEAIRDEAASVADLAGWSTMRLSAPLGLDDPARVFGLLATCNVFEVMGVRTPVAGRLLASDDCLTDAPIAVMSEGTWTRRFGRAPAVIGASMPYGSVSVTIVGVSAGPTIQRQATDPDADEQPDLYFPYTAYRSMKSLLDFPHGRDWLSPTNTWPWLEMAGHLKPGISRAAAEGEIGAIERRRSPKPTRDTALRLTNGSRWEASTDDILGLYALALVLPVLILIMASVSVAALLLSRAAGRRREMAVRLALGTNRRALFRMLFVESLVVTGAAAAVSLVFVFAAPPLLVRALDAELAFGSPDALTPNWRAFLSLGVWGVLAAMVSGLAPALESLSPRLAESVFGRAKGGSKRGMSRTRKALVAVQIAAGMVLLVTAVTFSRTASRIIAPGFSAEAVLVADIPPEQKRVSLGSLASALSGVAGVDEVAYAEGLPVAMRAGAMRIRTIDPPREVRPQATAIAPGYFDVLGLRVLAGRAFQSQDAGVTAGPKPIVVSRQLARRLFGDESALGRTIEADPRMGTNLVPMAIVGVVEDRLTGWAMTSSALTDGSMIYQPMPATATSGYLMVRARPNVGNLADRVGATLRAEIGAAVAVTSLDARLRESVSFVRSFEALLVALGVMSLGLALIGVIGSVSFDADQRRKEFAIRLALGAGPNRVRQHVLQSGLRAVCIGLALRVVASWGTLTATETMRLLPLRSVAADPIPYALVAGFLLMAAFLTLGAVAVPAGRRDPLEALREE